MTLTIEQAHEHIASEGARNGLTLQESLDMIHPTVRAEATPQQLVEHWDHYQQSHQLAQSTHPELANEASNIFLEEAEINQQRGNAPATEAEVEAAMAEQLEDWNDGDYDDNGIPDAFEDVDVVVNF